MAYQSTDVFRYLIFLQTYLLGDLSLFHKLSQDAEKKEKSNAKNSKGGLFRNILKLFNRIPSPPIIATTKYPYSFEFIFGSIVIPRSTIPHTATLFSTIDILGFLTRREQDYRSTKKNFQAFFQDSSINIGPREMKILTTVFRHGITHNYFPKLNMELSYHSENPKGRIFFKNQPGDLVLNINALERAVIQKLQDVISNSALFENMNSQFQIMTRAYEAESREDIEGLKRTL